MERAGQVNGTVHLTEKPRIMINFICEKLSGYVEPSQPAFTIPCQLGKGAGPFQHNCDSGRPAQPKI